MDFFIKCLAVLGGAGLGGFLGGWLLSWVHRTNYKGQNVPSWTVWIVRTLAAIAGGLLTYWIVFGGGGGGLGGQGGWSAGTKEAKKDGKNDPAKEEKKKEKESPSKEPRSTTLRVEVLGPEVLEKLKIDKTRCYRIEGRDPITRAEVVKAVKDGAASTPRLAKVEVVLYKDSPIEEAEPVAKLKTEIKDADKEVDVRMIDKKSQSAPME